ncbi:DM9 repeat-containing protein [Salmonella sp. S146_54837]|uniref:DM9 repeat-containing protein n=2 Tax=unclassified Salmonella TaxID=2614656 RepID=UPI0016597F12|nr:DM9 repeat-containing protein [Salmonella sp. S146_54837]
MKFPLFLLCGLFLYGSGTCQEWVSDSRGGIPAYAMKGGTDDYGRPLFVCKDYVHGEPCSGKISIYTGGCKLPWGNKEYVDTYYYVLTSPPWATYTLEWKRSFSKGYVPSLAVRIGSGTYVGRYKREGKYIPGKVVTKLKALFYGYSGKEYDVRKGYEVLVMNHRRVTSYKLKNVVYDYSRASETVSNDFQQLGARQRVTNNSPHEVDSTVSLVVQKEVSRSWSEMDQVETTIGTTTSVTASVPIIDVSQEWTESETNTYSYSYGGTTTHSVSSTHTITVKMSPYSECYVSMVAKKARFLVPFTGVFTMYFSDGRSYTDYHVTGVFEDTHMASYESRIE